jgi:hypothetical protein
MLDVSELTRDLENLSNDLMVDITLDEDPLLNWRSTDGSIRKPHALQRTPHHQPGLLSAPWFRRGGFSRN